MHLEEIQKTAVQLWDKINATNRPANEIIAAFLRTHRYVGANDRRTLYDFIWTALRYKARLDYLAPTADSAQKLALIDHIAEQDFSSAPLAVQWEVPPWLIDHIPQADKELPALLAEPPVILRAIGPRDKVQKALNAEGIPTTPTALSPLGLRVCQGRYNIVGSKTYKEGLVEIQDEGAQLIALDVGVKPKSSVFDFCAGAGGKSLLFAQVMGNKGEIAAYDASVRSLKELEKRASRAHISIIRTYYSLFPTYKKFDYVVVDAPCTGTGTWRRCPDARWHLTQKQLNNIVALQGEILDRASAYVRDGHFLAYMTCSLTQDENENQVDHFLLTHPDFTLLKSNRYSPYRSQTDGFFMALLQKR